MKKIISILSVVAILLCAQSSAFALDSSERIAWAKKMTPGANGMNISYWINPNCEYTNSIPAAANGISNPPGLSNKISLKITGTQSNSKLDFYQVNSNSGDWNNTIAATSVFRKNSSGNYYNSTGEKDIYDWVYADITINDYYLCDTYYNNNFKPAGGTVANFRKGVLIHEMGHAFGCRDLYKSGNKDSIMYGYIQGKTAYDLTSDANKVFNDKYN